MMKLMVILIILALLVTGCIREPIDVTGIELTPLTTLEIIL